MHEQCRLLQHHSISTHVSTTSMLSRVGMGNWSSPEAIHWRFLVYMFLSELRSSDSGVWAGKLRDRTACHMFHRFRLWEARSSRRQPPRSSSLAGMAASKRGLQPGPASWCM